MTKTEKKDRFVTIDDHEALLHQQMDQKAKAYFKGKLPFLHRRRVPSEGWKPADGNTYLVAGEEELL